MLAPPETSTVFALTRPMEFKRSVFFLVRHGQTELGAQGRWQGSKQDVGLTDLGRAEVAALIPFLPALPVYCSPMKRTLETAEIISQALNVEMYRLGLLIDADIGDWGGQTMEESDKTMTSEIRLKQRTHQLLDFPHGESISSLEDRIIETIDRLDPPIIVVGHQLPLQLLVCKLTGIPIDYARKLHIDEASLTIIRHTKIEVLNFKNRRIE